MGQERQNVREFVVKRMEEAEKKGSEETTGGDQTDSAKFRRRSLDETVVERHGSEAASPTQPTSPMAQGETEKETMDAYIEEEFKTMRDERAAAVAAVEDEKTRQQKKLAARKLARTNSRSSIATRNSAGEISLQPSPSLHISTEASLTPGTMPSESVGPRSVVVPSSSNPQASASWMSSEWEAMQNDRKAQVERMESEKIRQKKALEAKMERRRARQQQQQQQQQQQRRQDGEVSDANADAATPIGSP